MESPEKKMTPHLNAEKIQTAALRYKGALYTGEHHGLAYQKILDLTAPEMPLSTEVESGFVTTTGRFVDRFEGLRIATDQKQLNEKAVKRHLNSEHLRKDDEETP